MNLMNQLKQVSLQPELGAFILRITLGMVLIAHSVYLKAMVFTLPGTAQFFESIGLAGWMAYAVFAVEAIGGVALVLGAYTRLVSLALIPVLLGATWAHLGAGWLFTNTGGGYEYPLVLTVMAVVQLFLGAGRYALVLDEPERSAKGVEVQGKVIGA